MRLRELKTILDSINIAQSRLGSQYQPNYGRYDFSNIKKFKELISAIDRIPFFSNETSFLKKSHLYGTASDSLDILKDEQGQEISQASSHIFFSIFALSKVLSQMVNPLDENSIYIKLPNTSNFDNLLKDLNAFNTIISQVVTNDTIKGHVEIDSWESGSFWLNIMLGSQAAVVLIGSIAWSSAVVSKKIDEGKIIEAHVRSLEIKNNSLEDMLEAQKIMTQNLIDQEARSIFLQHFGKETDAETTERIKMAIKELAILIQKGAEINPALEAPEEAKNLFPDFDKLDSITSKIKQITG